MNGKRNGRLFPLIVALALVLSGPIAWAAGPVRVGKADAVAAGLLPINIGQQMGFFKKHGVEVKIYDFTGGSKMMQAMVAGSIDIAAGGGIGIAFATKGAPMRAVCESIPSYVEIGVAVPYQSPIQTTAQLKGKRIGISTHGSLTDWMATQLSEHEGWGATGVEHVAVGNGAAAAIAAFRTDAIDADIAITMDIFNWEEKKQARLLVPVASFLPNIGGTMIYASTQMMESEPGQLRGFLAGWLETITYLRTHKTETVNIYSEITGYPKSVLTKEYDLTIKAFSHDCKFDDQSMANLRRVLIEQKLVDSPPIMSTLYTDAYLPR